MKALVTGGAGYVGSHTVARLLEGGWDVVVYDNLKRGHAAALRVPLIRGELENTALLGKAFKDNRFDAVFHFAAYALAGESYQNPSMYLRHNVDGALALLDAMVVNDVPAIIFSSSCAVYGTPKQLPVTETAAKEPESPYGESKLMVERVLHWYGQRYKIKSTSLRYFNASGAALDGSIGEDHDPETHLLPNCLRAALGQLDRVELFGTDYPTRDGTCVRDYVHVVDLAEAHLAALKRLQAGGASAAYNVGSGKGYSVREVLDTAHGVTGKQFKVDERPRRAGDPAAVFADPSKIRDELGWEPHYSDIRTIVESAWRWHSSHPRGFES